MGDFDKSRKIAFLPGTSGVGKALAKNLAKAGYKILIGGAKLGEAKAAVKEIQKAAGSACPFIEAMDLKGAAAASKCVFFAMPVSGSKTCIETVQACLSMFNVQAEQPCALLPTGQSRREERPFTRSTV